MAWETRKRGGIYYYRSRREGGRVVKEYVGTGRIAALAARLDEAEREERAEAAAAYQTEQQRLEAADRPVADLCALTDALAAAALTLAGYHQHNRQWRRRRGPIDTD